MAKLKANAEIKQYTNSVQHNVMATVIDNLNNNKKLTFIDEDKVGTKNMFTQHIGFKISTIHGMTEILKELHYLGYKIAKKR